MVRRNFEFNGRSEIDYDGEPSRVQSMVNAGRAYVFGSSLHLTANIEKFFRLYGDISFTEGRDLSEDLPLRHVAPLFGRAGFSFNSKNFRIDLFSHFNSEKSFDQLSPSEQNKTHLYTENGTPGWATLNAKASLKIHKSIRIGLGIENISDKHYRPYSSGISAPGRNFIFAVRSSI